MVLTGEEKEFIKDAIANLRVDLMELGCVVNNDFQKLEQSIWGKLNENN